MRLPSRAAGSRKHRAMCSAPASVIAPPSHSSRRLAHAGSAAASPAAPASLTCPEMLSTLSVLGASRACNRR